MPKVQLPVQARSRYLRPSLLIGMAASFASTILIVWVLFFQSDNNIEIEVKSVGASKQGRLELQGLTYRGQTQAGDNYEINAARAAEDSENPNLVNLTKIAGTITNQENGAITLASNEGQFDQLKNIVQLSGDVIITKSARDLTFTTAQVQGDLDVGDFTAPEDVLVTSPQSQITGEAMFVSNFGDKIIFKGQSKAIIKEDDNS